MLSKIRYILTGTLITTGSGIIINLLSSGIQQRTFPTQFSDQALWILAGLALFGSLVGYWLSGQLQVPPSSSHPPSPYPLQPDVVTLTRLQAFLSYSKLKGKGIHLSDIVMIGTRIDIET
ncbi:MAG: hypothetical protein NVSMB38_44780 [Ktedonobacteraceae bacterium]